MASKIHVTTDSGEAAATFSALTIEELATLVNDINVSDDPNITPVPITTGAITTDAELDTLVYEITTGGTASVEIINLPNYDLTVGSISNPTKVGKRIIFYLAAQTDPADSVKITVGGSGSIAIHMTELYNNAKEQNLSGGAILDYEGSIACFIWVADRWVIDRVTTDILDSSTTIDNLIDFYVRDNVESGIQAQGVRIHAGNSTVGNTRGGDVEISSGDANGTQRGGDINVTLGAGTTKGRLILNNLPTSDPAIAGQVWNSSGTLKISAG